MSVRLYVSPATLAAGPREVEGDDYRYLFRVRRLAVGDAVTLFDGAGREAAATVSSVTGKAAVLDVETPKTASPPDRPQLVVLPSLIKGDRMTTCIEKLTELGADRIAPVSAARSVVRLDAERAAARRDKFEATARQAAAQCRRPTLPVIEPIRDLEDAVAAVADVELKLVMWESASAPPLPQVLPERAPHSVALLVGPEGGLTDDELAISRRADFVPFGLGPRILRAETAALAGLVALGVTLGDLGS